MGESEWQMMMQANESNQANEQQWHVQIRLSSTHPTKIYRLTESIVESREF